MRRHKTKILLRVKVTVLPEVLPAVLPEVLLDVLPEVQKQISVQLFKPCKFRSSHCKNNLQKPRRQLVNPPTNKRKSPDKTTIIDGRKDNGVKRKKHPVLVRTVLKMERNLHVGITITAWEQNHFARDCLKRQADQRQGQGNGKGLRGWDKAWSLNKP